MFPLECETIAATREREWQAERESRHLLSKLPRRPNLWRRRTSSMIVFVGAWLMKWGEWMAEFEHRQVVLDEREYSSQQ